jgi:hypothetical protein
MAVYSMEYSEVCFENTVLGISFEFLSVYCK